MSNNIDLEESLKNQEVQDDEVLKSTNSRPVAKRTIKNKLDQDLTNYSREELASMLKQKEEEEEIINSETTEVIVEEEKEEVTETPTIDSVKSTITKSEEVYDISDLTSDEDVESDILKKIESGETVANTTGYLQVMEDTTSTDSNTVTITNEEPIVNFDAVDTINFNSDDNSETKSEDKTNILDEDDTDIDETKYIYKHYNDQVVTGRSINTKLDFVNNLSVDLNNVTITKASPIQQANEMKALFDVNVPTFTVVCCQSGYTANLTGLTLSEKNAIANSEGTIYEARNRLYRTVYNKIHSMSISKPDYNNWLKITSYNDLSTLLFGVYCQTFIDNNDFEITCGRCGKTTSVTVNNQSLVEVKDRETYEKRDEIISGIKTGEDLVKHSLVHKDQRVMLDDSKIIVDICTPSLFDHLTLLRITKPEVLERYADTLSVMLFISHMYMMNLDETYRSGSPSYYELEKKAQILDVLLKLSNSDGEQLESAIESRIGKLRIDYQIHGVTCAHCHAHLPGIPVDIENILFTRLNRTKTAS